MDDRELFARLIQCEAGGEGDNGMRAVASVVMNRVNAPGGEYKRVGQAAFAKSCTKPASLYVCPKQSAVNIIHKTSITCARNRSIMT